MGKSTTIKIGIMVLICIMPLSFAYERDIATIDRCFNTSKIEVQTESDIYYNITKCNYDDKYWICPCDNPFNIIVTFNKYDIFNEFDFIIWYNLEDTSRMNEVDIGNVKRKVEHNNILLEYVEPPKTLEELEKEKKQRDMIIYFIIGIALVIVITVSYIGYRAFRRFMDEE